jgi:hypothetical protein
MEQDDATNLGPPRAGLGGKRLEPGNNLLLVGLVGEVLHVVAAVGVIPNGATEQHDCTAAGTHGPVVGIADGEHRVGETEPVVAIGRNLHRPIVAVRRSSRRPQEPPQEYDLAFVERAPLPPHERTWRHPSEVAADSAIAMSAERPSATARTMALLTGTAGVLLIGIFVLSITPRGGNEPLATSSTPTTDQVPLAQMVAPVAVSRPMSWAPGPQPIATLVGTTGLAVVTSRALGRMAPVVQATQGGTASVASSVTVRLDDGTPARASILDPGDGTGLAIVALEGPIAIEGMPVAHGQPQPHESVTVMADEPIVVAYADIARLDVADGTAVANRAGELIGLCSEDAAQRFIPIDELLVDATTAPD